MFSLAYGTYFSLGYSKFALAFNPLPTAFGMTNASGLS